MKNNKSNPFSFLKGIKIKLPKRKIKKAPGDIIYSPAEDIDTTKRIIGLALRALTLFLGIFGMTAFICDAFEFTVSDNARLFSISGGYMAFVGIVVSAVFCLIYYNRLTSFAVPPVALGVYIGLCAVLHGNPFSYIYYSVLRMINYACYTQVLRGYTYFQGFMIPDGFDYSGSRLMTSDPYRSGGVVILAVIIGIVLSLAMMKKVRLWILVPFTALIMWPILTYNMTASRLGFVFITAFAASCISLYVYDYRFAGGLEKKHKKLQRKEEKAEIRKKEKAIKAEEKQKLREEADKMLLCALSADMGAKRSKMARKAVIKAAKKAKKTAAKNKKKAAKEEKRLAKKAAKAEKATIKKLRSSAKSGNAEAAEQLKQFDREKADRKKVRLEKKALKKAKAHNSFLVSAAGGYAGAGAAVLAFAAVLFPVLIMTKAFPEIPVIYDTIDYANSYVESYLSGSEVDLNDPEVYGPNPLAPRTLTFDALEFEDASMFLITSTSEYPIYLKSWSGESFDYGTSTWKSADIEKLVKYRELFGAEYSPDSIGTDFKKYVYPSSAHITEPEVYENFSQYGFSMQSVSIERLGGTSRLMFIPTQLNTDWNILALGTLDATEHKYSSYYDGTYSTRFFGRGYTYQTISFIPVMNRRGVYDEFENAIEYYNLSYEAISAAGDSDDTDALIYDYEMALQDSGIHYIGTSIADRYFNSMTDSEKDAYISSVKDELKYRDYVKETYLSTTGSETVNALALEIKALADSTYGEPTVHEYILTLLEYLSDNYTYTLEPDATKYTPETNYLESFLFEVKEGYCTHFATAAAQLLREIGIPTRYCEGYLADEMYKSFGGYSAEILDSDAHAWIEVYYDTMGWVQYEVTPPYLESYYAPNDSTIVEDSEKNEISHINPGELNENDVKPPKDDGDITGADEKMTEVEIFLTVLTIVIIGIILFIVIRFLVKRFVKRGTNMLFERYRLIARAKDEAVYKDSKTDNHKIARALNDQILDIFIEIGAGPESGEVSREYGERIKQNYGNLSKEDPCEVFRIIQKEEFGDGITYEEMCTLAEYLAEITVSVYAGLSFTQKMIKRYIKRKI